MQDLASRFNSVTHAIASAERAAARVQGSVRLLAVSKTFEAPLAEALFHMGQRAFGENYVQEAVAKMDVLTNLRSQIEWHLIGPLQSNKTALVAEKFDWVQTIDRFKIAQRLNDQRPVHLPPLSVCIQINVDGGANKSGLDCTHGLQPLLDMASQMGSLQRLHLRGLLAIPEPESDQVKQLAIFGKVREAFDLLNQKGFKLDTLSMGMSSDYAAAIAAGSTMVRVGSAIFGERHKLA